MIIFGVSLPLPWVVVVGVVITIVDMIILVIIRRQPRQPSSNNSALERLQATASHMIGTGIGAAMAMVAPLAPTNSSGVSLFAILTRANAVLAGYDAPALTTVELVRDAYLVQARLALVMLVGGVSAVGLLMLIISGIIAFVKHRVSRNS
jgi:hypothetical protein